MGQCTYEQIAHCDGAVRVDDQAVSTQRRCVFELGRYEHTDGGEQLELRPTNGQYGQHSVEVVDGQREHLILTLLLGTDLHQQLHHH